MSNAPNLEAPENLDLDLVWGLNNIGKAINRSERQARYLLELGALPCGRVGRRLFASRTELRRVFSSILRGESADAP
jgi:hypothetical protein